LYDGETLVGAMFYGRMAMRNQYKKFSDKEEDVTELRRLVCIDDTPKNTESYFIARTLKWLKKNTEIKVVVSYADSEYNHSGTIYKASNFEYLGKQKGAKVIVWGDKKFHDKSIRTMYKGKLKPFAQKIKDALESGEAFYKETEGKHTFVYKLKK
jgi:Ribonuclease G/E